jgi:hypothetical protein
MIVIPKETSAVFNTFGYNPELPPQLTEAFGGLPKPPIVRPVNLYNLDPPNR